MSIQRYYCYGKDDLGCRYDALYEPDNDGDWVFADEHAAEVESLRSQLAEAERKLTRWHCVWCEHTTITTGNVKNDIETLRVHTQTCDGNPLVRRIIEMQRIHNSDQARLAEAEQEYQDARDGQTSWPTAAPSSRATPAPPAPDSSPEDS